MYALAPLGTFSEESRSNIGKACYWGGRGGGPGGGASAAAGEFFKYFLKSRKNFVYRQ